MTEQVYGFIYRMSQYVNEKLYTIIVVVLEYDCHKHNC
jgi:hypothetical protein